MVTIDDKNIVAEKLKFVSRKLAYTVRIMKRQADDTKAVENISLCESLLKEILEENTRKG